MHWVSKAISMSDFKPHIALILSSYNAQTVPEERFLFYRQVIEEGKHLSLIRQAGLNTPRLWSFTKSAFRAEHLTLVALIQTSHKGSSTLENMLALGKSL